MRSFVVGLAALALWVGPGLAALVLVPEDAVPGWTFLVLGVFAAGLLAAGAFYTRFGDQP